MKQKSQHAQVAALCKRYVRTMELECTVRSSSFSMGDSVYLTVINPTPEKLANIKAELKKYQSGGFNGQEDIYDYSNTREDIPQTKYLFIKAEYTDCIKKEALAWYCDRFLETETGEKIKAMDLEEALQQFVNLDDMYTHVSAVLSGKKLSYNEHNERVSFWN